MKRLRQIAPWVAAVASLWWVGRDFDAGTLQSQWHHLNWTFVLAAVGFDVLAYVLQGFRWSTVLRPAGRLSPWRATQAIYIGLFANEILPLRAGEVIRSCIAARWLRIPPVSVVPSLVLERVLDGIWLTAGVLITAHLIPFSGLLAQAARMLYVGVASAVLVLTVLVWAAPRGPRFSWLKAMRGGLRGQGASGRTAAATVWSFGLLGSQCLSFWFALRSCGLEFPLWAGCGALVIVRLGTMVPAAPANAGTYQLFCTLALTMFGIGSAAAASASILVFLMLTLPLWVLGSLALLKTGMSLGELRGSAEVPIG